MRALVLAVAVAACSHGSSATPEPPLGNEGSNANPVIAGDAAPAADCVRDCIARNQMRAVGAEVIEADCKRDCAEQGALAPAPDAPPSCQRYLELVRQYLECDKLTAQARDHAVRGLATKRMVWGPGLSADGFAAIDQACDGSIRDLQTGAEMIGCAIEKP